MKKTIVLLLAVFLFSGCMSQAERQARIDKQRQQLYEQRQQLIATFKEAYPDTWKQKLLEYDLQQQAIWAIRQERARQNRQKSWREFGEALKKSQEYPIIYPLNSCNYWQERLARQRVIQGY